MYVEDWAGEGFEQLERLSSDAGIGHIIPPAAELFKPRLFFLGKTLIIGVIFSVEE